MAAITGAAIGAGAILGGTAMQSRAVKKASRAQRRSAQDSLAYQRESRDLALGYNKPYRDASYRATAALMDLAGLSRGMTVAPGMRGPEDGITARPGRVAFEGGMPGTPKGGVRSNQAMRLAGASDVTRPGNVKGERGRMFSTAAEAAAAPVGADVPDLASYEEYDFQTDPGYQFRMDEGMRALERGAAARGGLLSGGFARKALRYSQDYASNEYMNVFNRIATIAGFGQVSTANSTGAIMQSAAMGGNAMMAAGEARASGYIGQGNAWANAVNEIAQIDWGSVFNGGGAPASSMTPARA